MLLAEIVQEARGWLRCLRNSESRQAHQVAFHSRENRRGFHFQIADISEVWVQAEVYEKDVARVRLGQNAYITVDTYPEEQFLGKVTYVSDILDRETRTAKVRCEVPNPQRKLKLDMFATVRVPTTFSRTALAVPGEAIQQLDSKTVVFVRKADTTFEVREITTGRTVDSRTEVVSGLHWWTDNVHPADASGAASNLSLVAEQRAF